MQSRIDPYLSIVVTARNDNHGGNLLQRFELFLKSLQRQSQHFSLPMELVVVEWNPPCGALRLREVLPRMGKNPYLDIRYIEVPNYIHKKYQYADILPLFQMIGKNVGIRRCKAPFVLCTNIDILFSDSLIEYLAKKELDFRKVYRVARYDIDIRNTEYTKDTEEILRNAETLTIRKHYRSHSYDCINEKNTNRIYFPEKLRTKDRSFDKHIGTVFTNACGDFQLLDKQTWLELQGYEEFETYSMHIDSMFGYKAHCHGIEEIELPESMLCYHLEHGAGFTPEASKDGSFQKRYNKSGMQEMENMRQLGWQMHYSNEITHINKDTWGLSDYSLPEYGHDERLSFSILFCPKGFVGEYSQLQRNAIISWLSLEPKPEIILLGNDEGCQEVAQEFNLKHIPDIDRNSRGTPLVSSLFGIGQANCSNSTVVYINSDIILFPSFVENIRQVLDRNPSDFLLVGERYDLDVYESFSTDIGSSHLKEQIDSLYERCFKEGKAHGKRGIDYFVFRKGMYDQIPPFALGRLVWDQWLCWSALDRQIPMIEAHGDVVALHQNHTYNYSGNNTEKIRNGVESRENSEMAWGRLRRRHMGTSQFILKENELYWRHNNESLQAFSPFCEIQKSAAGVYLLSREDLARNKESVLSLADSFYFNKDYKEALRIYHRLALDLENGDAMVNLAELFTQGNGVDQDFRIAAYWLRRMSKLSKINGNNCYSLIFEKWNGGINPASYWQKMMYEKGGDIPAYMLVLVFIYGLSVERDLDYVVQLFDVLQGVKLNHASNILYQELRISGNYTEKKKVFKWLHSKRKENDAILDVWLQMALTTFPDAVETSEIPSIVSYFLGRQEGNKLADIAIAQYQGKRESCKKSIQLLKVGSDQGCTYCQETLKEFPKSYFWIKEIENG